MVRSFLALLLMLASASCTSANLPPPGHKVQTSVEIVAHPAGCPLRLFCGCGASKLIFGRPIASLYSARAWLRFPRAAPAPGRAAVRPHHVFVLLDQVSGSVWRVYDANGGGHLTMVHLRSIKGWTIVDPRGRG
jgi:hypothetical protein